MQIIEDSRIIRMYVMLSDLLINLPEKSLYCPKEFKHENYAIKEFTWNIIINIFTVYYSRSQ